MRSALTRKATDALSRRMGRFFRREDGTATIEFAIFMPLTVLIFLASVESGFYMVREAMMGRGLDLVMRQYKLGLISDPSHDNIRNMICDSATMLNNCKSELKVWIEPVNTSTWAMPTSSAYCGNGNGSLNAPPEAGTVANGTSDELMIVRICALQKPLFPTTRFTSKLRADSVSGGYQLALATIVVNEPRN